MTRRAFNGQCFNPEIDRILVDAANPGRDYGIKSEILVSRGLHWWLMTAMASTALQLYFSALLG